MGGAERTPGGLHSAGWLSKKRWRKGWANCVCCCFPFNIFSRHNLCTRLHRHSILSAILAHRKHCHGLWEIEDQKAKTFNCTYHFSTAPPTSLASVIGYGSNLQKGFGKKPDTRVTEPKTPPRRTVGGTNGRNQPMLQKGEIGWLGWLGSCEPWSSYDERCRMSLMLHVRSPDWASLKPTAGLKKKTHTLTLRRQTFWTSICMQLAAGLAFGCFLGFPSKKFVIRFCGSFLYLCTMNGRTPVTNTKASVRSLRGQML